MSNDEWKKEKMKVVCDIMNELVQKEGIQCMPEMLTPTLVQASAASVSGSSASSTSSPETIEQIRQKALDRLVNLLESNPEVKHVLAQTDISETTYWLVEDKNVLTALEKIKTAEASQVSTLEKEGKKIIEEYVGKLTTYINKYKRPTFMTKRTPIIMPGYFPEYALPPLNKQSYASDFKKLVYMYAKLIDYEFANKSTNTTIMLTAAEIEERKNILNKYPIQFKNFNETYGETINKYRAILSRPSLKPVAPKPLQSGKQTPEGWGKVKTKLDDLLSKYNNLDKGSDEEKKINKIKYFEELQEYEKIKKIHSISGGSRRNMNRGRRFTRKVIH